MTRVIALCLLTLTGCSASHASQRTLTTNIKLDALIKSEQKRVEAFFASPFPKPFETRVFSTRRDMETFAAKKWNVPQLPCWAVAMGTASTLAILDPAVWAAQACEHDGSDAEQVRGIVAHELVHVFHGQHNPDPEFDHSDDLAWFIEGLAVYASGQLTPEREWQATKAAAAGLPRKLAEAWSGNARYAVAGSLARFVDQRIGRAATLDALGLDSSNRLLSRIGLSEDELLSVWRTAMTR